MLTVAVDDHLDHLIQQLGLAAPEPREILLHDREHIVLVAAGLACGMWRDEHVLHGPQWRGRRQRLLDRDVERGAPDLPSRERVDERRLIDHAPARCVEKIRGRLHAAERIGIDQLLGFRRQRAGEGNEIGLRQQCVEVGHRVHRIRVSGTGARVAADADHAYVERLGELRQPAADLSEADDQQRLDEVKDLRREATALKEVVADLTLENRLLKKSVTADGEDEA